MSKADEKALKRHPRYAALLAAHTRMQERIAAAQKEIDAAKEDFQAAAPELEWLPTHLPVELRAFAALRPKGDTVRVMRLGVAGRAHGEEECEIENVTATLVTLVGHVKPFRDGRCGGYDTSYRIHEDDLARIQSGELKGWRQKPWAR